MKILRRLIAVILLLIGLFLLIMGGELVAEGGSTYYAIVGVIYVISAVFLWRKSRVALWLTGLALLGTVLWTYSEVGSAYWGWFARLLVPLGIFAVVSLLSISRSTRLRWGYLGSGLVSLLIMLVFIGRALFPMPVVQENALNAAYNIPAESNTPLNWTAYSRDNSGTRYSPFNQINRDTVKNLKLAWTYRTGRNLSNPNQVDQNTPLQIGNTLYACTPENNIHAINATTGEGIWKYVVNAQAPAWARCRGLGYYQDPTATAGRQCAARIIGTTVDGRLHELDAASGKPCEDFGSQGSVDLRKNMGPEGNGYYYQTSAPLVADNLIVVGGWIADNQGLGEPAGAIRAYDVHSGALVWTWDPGNPAVTREPVDGSTYTLGTPNMWTTAAYDPQLGLIYAPMGNAGTDYFNADRPEASRPYSSALVALDIHTGKPRWAYQTVHDDLWDYDLPAQPALVNMPADNGQQIPAVIQLTKRGQIFVLDRRDGKPITRVVERPVPSEGAIPENHVSPTQPYSVGMPSIGDFKLTEASSWGMTLFDQLMCRIQFKKLRYDGDFTQPGLRPGLVYAGALGGMNWGSASYDPVNQRVFVNDIRLPNIKTLLTRADYNNLIKTHPPTPDGHGIAAMAHTPYGVTTSMWMSPLGIPCLQPPLGTITAIDLNSRKIAWQVPAGTTEDVGPLGIKTHLPLQLGLPTYAGTSTTAGGLVFFAGFQDNYLRAYDAQTGKVVWKARLPVGASATPMAYISPVNGKEYIVISAGGAAHSPDVGDYLMAFTLQ